MGTLLEVEDLSISLSTPSGPLRAVRGIDFSVAAGETLCLVGESGCGKSLTALAVMNLLPRTARRQARRLAFAGESLMDLSERAMADLRGRRIAMIFQDPTTSLNPTLPVGLQITEGLMRHERISAAAARGRAIELLERVGIGEAAARLHQYPHNFSGGQRQRMVIASALMTRPALLIADEPTTALDVTIQAQILALLDELRREFRLALLLITHDLGIVARLADRIAVMYAGAIVERGNAADVFSAPQHPYTQGLIGAIPVPGRTPPGTHLAAIPGRVPELIGDVSGCAFRDRCAFAETRCALDPVPIQLRGASHAYACILPPRDAREAA
jgi:peptide/nickel transport system ATP-binding protein